jgi:hypothetical protein
MLKVIDRIFGVLLIVGACGHTVGTFLWTQPMSGIFIWSLGSSLAAALLGTLNIVRAGRPDDKALAAITTVGSACWAILALAFGVSIGNVLDSRPLRHALIAGVLTIFGALTFFRGSKNPQSEPHHEATELTGT